MPTQQITAQVFSASATPARQISPDQFSDAINWKRNVAQALDTIHVCLQTHDVTGLENALSTLSANDLIVVEELYRATHGKSISDRIEKELNLSPDAQAAIDAQMRRKPDFSAAEQSTAGGASHAQIARALTWLGQNTSTLKFYEFKAKQGNVLIDMGKSQQSGYIPFVFDNRVVGRETELRGQVERDAAEEILKRTISAYSADELKAIQALSLLRSKVPGQGILEELVNSPELSDRTKSFIIDESQKRGLEILRQQH